MDVELGDHNSFFRDELEMMCALATPPLSADDVLNVNRKPRPIARMRAQFVREMRRLVGQRGWGANRRYVHFVGGRPDRWEPVSYPTLAAFLGLDHSALVPRKRAGGTGKAR